MASPRRLLWGVPRVLTLPPRDYYEAIRAARREQDTNAFHAAYAARAGIESTHAQAVRRSGLRRCRYRGLAKTRLQHVLTAAALNVVRVAEWHAGARPGATARSAFARLRPAAYGPRVVRHGWHRCQWPRCQQ